MIRIAVVDDHELFRESVVKLINTFNECMVVFEASNGLDFCEALPDLEIDIVILDLSMPGQNGIVTCSEAININPELKVLACSMFDDKQTVAKMLEKGASGFITKHGNSTEMEEAIRKIYNGGNYFIYDLKDLFSTELFQADEDCLLIGEGELLSEREKEIVRLICKQMTNHEIADQLKLGVRTVESHRRNILDKTNSKNIVGVVLYANQHNII